MNLHEDPALEIRTNESEEGFIRLSLKGELDIVGIPQLEKVLSDFRTGGAVAIRLDLSELSFIDSSGLRGLIGALMDARNDGYELSIERDVSPQAARVIELTGMGDVFWPS